MGVRYVRHIPDTIAGIYASSSAPRCCHSSPHYQKPCTAWYVMSANNLLTVSVPLYSPFIDQAQSSGRICGGHIIKLPNSLVWLIMPQWITPLSLLIGRPECIPIISSHTGTGWKQSSREWRDATKVNYHHILMSLCGGRDMVQPLMM